MTCIWCGREAVKTLVITIDRARTEEPDERLFMFTVCTTCAHEACSSMIERARDKA